MFSIESWLRDFIAYNLLVQHTGNNLLKIREFWYIPKNHFFDLSPTGLFFKIDNIDFLNKKKEFQQGVSGPDQLMYSV